MGVSGESSQSKKRTTILKKEGTGPASKGNRSQQTTEKRDATLKSDETCFGGRVNLVFKREKGKGHRKNNLKLTARNAGRAPFDVTR